MASPTGPTHRTAVIARPTRHDAERLSDTRDSHRDSHADHAPLRLDDLTRGIPADKQLISGSGRRALITLLAVAVFGGVAAMMFVLPVKSWIRQRDDIANRQHELNVIRDANARLDAEIARLQTVEGTRQAARDELGWVDRNETQYRITDDTDVALTLPTGWPFATVASILTARGVVLPAPDAQPTP